MNLTFIIEQISIKNIFNYIAQLFFRYLSFFKTGDDFKIATIIPVFFKMFSVLCQSVMTFDHPLHKLTTSQKISALTSQNSMTGNCFFLRTA